MMSTARLYRAVTSTRVSIFRPPRHHLQTWAEAFEEASGAPLATRLALAEKLQSAGAWEVKMETQDSTGLAAAAGSSSSAMTFKLQVEGTAVAILRAALLPPSGADPAAPATGLLIGAQVHPALPLRAAGEPLVEHARRVSAR